MNRLPTGLSKILVKRLKLTIPGVPVKDFGGRRVVGYLFPRAELDANRIVASLALKYTLKQWVEVPK